MEPLCWGDKNTQKQLKNMLEKDKVILAEGDTVLGLLANIFESSYNALDRIKKRSQKPYLLLVKDKEKAFNFIEKEAIKVFQIEKLIDVCWPGPVTLIFKAKTTVPRGVKSAEGNVAMRIPDHDGLQELLTHFDALYSTSANTTGKEVPSTIAQVEKSILDSVESIVLNKNRSDSLLPSTIIDCTQEKIKLVRQGAFPLEKLADFL